MRVKVYTHPSSEQNLKVKVKKIGETVAQSKVYIPPTDDFDPTDEVIDNLNYEAIKNGEIEDPDYDERSAEWPR